MYNTYSDSKQKFIVLIGNVKYENEFLEIKAFFESDGHHVIMPSILIHSENKELTPEKLNDEVLKFRRYIEMSDIVFVIDVNSYVDAPTLVEIEYAKSLHKEIRFYSKEFNDV